MKPNLTAIAVFAATVGAVGLYPAIDSIGALNPPTPPSPIALPPTDPLTNERGLVEVVFVLDTTGSMGGMIDAAKEKIWSIASSMASAEPAPTLRMGLVGYRDRGDEYVTQSIDLSTDLDSLYASLMDFRAAGGGDGPESVNQALYQAVHGMSWSQEPDAYRVVFLVGDAPPHMDYQNDVKYPVTVAAAQDRGIVVNTIQCGEDRQTNRQWQTIAQLGGGGYFQVEQNGGALAVATPLDRRLAELSRELDATRLYYGSTEDQARLERKLEAAEKVHGLASESSRARRAAFNASDTGTANLFGEQELVDRFTHGHIRLEDIDPEELPTSLKGLSSEKRQAVVQELAEQRADLQRRIQDLAQQRAELLKARVAAMPGAAESLDHQLYETVRTQAESKGLHYDADTPAY
jgi:Mg-chelatase subunit ChlD